MLSAGADNIWFPYKDDAHVDVRLGGRCRRNRCKERLFADLGQSLLNLACLHAVAINQVSQRERSLAGLRLRIIYDAAPIELHMDHAIRRSMCSHVSPKISEMRAPLAIVLSITSRLGSRNRAGAGTSLRRAPCKTKGTDRRRSRGKIWSIFSI